MTKLVFIPNSREWVNLFCMLDKYHQIKYGTDLYYGTSGSEEFPQYVERVLGVKMLHCPPDNTGFIGRYTSAEIDEELYVQYCLSVSL